MANERKKESGRDTREKYISEKPGKIKPHSYCAVQASDKCWDCKGTKVPLKKRSTLRVKILLR